MALGHLMKKKVEKKKSEASDRDFEATEEVKDEKEKSESSD